MAKQVYFPTGRRIDRRTMLKASGVSLALPWLSAMQPAFAAAAPSPRRFVAITLGLGLHAENLNPATDGRDYQPSRYLKVIDDLRDEFTVISGSSHPDVNGGHRAEASLLTANPGAGTGRSKNTISFDQHLAKYLGHETRFPSLVLASSGNNSPSYTEDGAMIPAENSPSRLYSQLFVDDTPEERARQAQRVQEGRSIMDLVGEDTARLQRELGAGDRDRLDAYFTSIRDLEKRMAADEAWAKRPKPKVDAPKPVDIGDGADFVGRQQLMCDMIRLALETDSTRCIAFHLGAGNPVVPVDGVEHGYHTLSHHGRDEEKLEQLALIETEIIRAWGDFLRDLRGANDGGSQLLDQTSVLLTSNLGNASNHSNRNMPVLFAGGGFRHGQHLAFSQKNNYPLPKLFVSVMQQMGLEQEKFATASGTMTGLDTRS